MTSHVQDHQSEKEMIFFIVPVALILASALWIVFTPVYLKVDTARQVYNVSQAGTISVAFHPGETTFMEIRVLGISVRTSRREMKQTTSKKTEKSRIVKRRSIDAWLYLFKGIAGSVHCQKLACTFDTDDVVLNARLVPLLILASSGPVQVNINFRQVYLLELVLEARIYKMVVIFLRFLNKK